MYSQHSGGRDRRISVCVCVFKASLVYIAGSRTARATQRNPVLENKRNKCETERERERERERPEWRWRTPCILTLRRQRQADL